MQHPRHPLSLIRLLHPMMGPHNNHHQPMPHHNMHMGNQRNQNNKFNHDRHDNYHQPFFRNNQFYQQNHNNMRFHNMPGQFGPMGPYMHLHHHHNNHHLSSNGIGPNGELDEFAGLMNNREKQWLHSIQLLQLNTNQPYIDDYYYTVFCDRVHKKNINNKNSKTSDNKGGRNNNNSNGFRDSR